MVKPPLIDERNTRYIVKQVQRLLQKYVPDLQESENFSTGDHLQATGINTALIHIFARYAEIIIQRLNQVPHKNFLAFLDLLGASLQPPQPARVPLLFFLAPGSEVDAIIPARTQVAALSAEGEDESVIFETERDLVVTPAQLKSIFVRDPQQDKYSDRSHMTSYNSNISTDAISAVPIFEGNEPVDHSFDIISDTLLKHSDLRNVTLTLLLEQDLQNPEPRSVKWEICAGLQCLPIPRDSINDQTSNLTRSGTVVFTNLDELIQIIVNSKTEETEETEETKRRLRCRLQTPISTPFSPEDDRLGSRGEEMTPTILQQEENHLSQLPTIRSVSLQAIFGKNGYLIEEAFTNVLPVDLSKPFFPFGEQPKFGETLYLANQEVFSKSGATVTLHIDLADLAAVGIPLPITNKDPNANLEWEVWTDRGWVSVGTSTPEGPLEPLSPPEVKFRDTTQAFTVPGLDRVVEFILPDNLKPTIVNEIESFWLRVRIKSGNYGEDARYEEIPGSYVFTPASFKPPLINSIKIDCTLTTPQQQPDGIYTYNDFYSQIIPLDSSFEPFKRSADSQPILYMGFSLPESRNKFPNSTLSLYFQLADAVYNSDTNPNLAAKNSSSLSSPRLVWEYWSHTNNWKTLIVRDDTEAFTRAGLVDFLPPFDFDKKLDFNSQEELYWLRVYKEPQSGEYFVKPQLKRVLLNTTIAIQAFTINDEILGSSNGEENQSFLTTQLPVLKGEYLEVREPEMPSLEELQSIKRIYNDDGISVITDDSGSPEEIWVRWSEVPDFYGSGSRDRHYIIDRNSGEIRFGDGVKGRIPPVGIANVRIRRYQAGGGTAGNRPENTIVELQTTIPYIDTVTNPVAATGGANTQTLDSLIELAPRAVRHGGRAVTFEDYEDLAMQATPEVVRAKSIPLLNLYANPLDIQNPLGLPPKAPGEVSLIIVPRTSDLKPLPSIELIKYVQDYLEKHAIGTAKIWVVGPVYIEVVVSVDIVPTSLEKASAVQKAVDKALTDFLHPLTGGFDGQGWVFGRQPHNSDLYALLEAVPGVDHVHRLSIIIKPGSNPPQNIQQILDTKRFLVYSGKHTINLLFI
jgi:Baseplate J-like protein